MSISQPEISFSIIPAERILELTDNRALIVGQMLSGGSATPGELVQDISNDSSEYNTLFGEKSHLAGLVRAFKRDNKLSPLDVIPLADPTGSAGTAQITFTGTASLDGRYYISVGSKKDHRYQIEVEKDDTGDIIAGKVVALVNADTKAPFTALEATNTVTFTCEHDGVISNSWGVKVEGLINDVLFTITGWTGGAGTPVLTGVLDGIENIRYRHIVWPSEYPIEEIEDDLNAKYNTSNRIMDGVAIQTKSDTLANLKAYVLSVNSQSIVVPQQRLVNSDITKGPASLEMPDIISSETAAIRALRFTDNAPLTQYLTTAAPKDQFGGFHLATLPYFNTLMPYMPVAAANDEFTEEELQELSNNGVANIGPNTNFTSTIFGTIVTTYLTDSAANPDTSFKFLNTVDTASVIREFYFINCRARYSQTRLTPGDLLPGYSMANLASIRAFCKRLYKELSDVTITAAGSEAIRDFDNNLILTPDYAKGEVFLQMAPLLVNQLRVLLGTIQVKFIPTS